MAWTPHGGEILFIEANTMPGQGKLVLTGQLGEVMSESVRIAMSYVRSRAQELSITEEYFKEHDFHVHFPAGATPKDGPSAGIAIATALLSVMLHRVPVPRLSMTGELTLSGTVLPVGGIKEKVLGARRAGVTEILLPAQNGKDLIEIPDEMKEGLNIHLVDHYDQVMGLAFNPPLLSSGIKKSPKAKVKKTKKKKKAS
jgi:ATP-dependent Lon protease